ncbi:MAG: DUF3108 domain-containing protein [Calditrichaeota bacterium]|nr:MAG: DUF3108 domain-containing protein [Calditrichota bacterium]
MPRRMVARYAPGLERGFFLSLFLTMMLTLTIEGWSQHQPPPDSLNKDSLSMAARDTAAADSLALPDSVRIRPPVLYEAEDTLALDSTAGRVAEDRILYHPDRVIPNHAFDVGERLIFRIRYGFITAGRATMEVKEVVMVHDSIPAYRILSTARSAKFFDSFYKVRDSVESYMDVRGLFSWKFHKRLREGGYKFDLLAEYDQWRGVAYVTAIRYHSDEPLRIKRKEEFELEIPLYVLDVLGAFYYVRTQELRVGEPIYMSNHDNKKVYNLQVIIQKKERVKVKAGTFDCVMVSPRLKGEGIFKHKGELWIWLTDDERKIPVKMTSKVPVGSITTELIRIEGVDGNIRARVD